MNQQQQKHDRTLYTREPYVYIGFNNQREEAKMDVEGDKRKIVIEEKKTTELYQNNALIGKKRRMRSSHEKEFLIDFNKTLLEEDHKSKVNSEDNKKSVQEMTALKIKKEIKINSQVITEKTAEKDAIHSRCELNQSTKLIDAEKKYDQKKLEKKLDKQTANKNISNNSHSAITEKNKINLPSNNLKNENHTSTRLLIDNIFNSEIDFKPKKKEEFVQRQAIEKFNCSYNEFLTDAKFNSVTKKIDKIYHSNNYTTLFHLHRFVKDNDGIENGKIFLFIYLVIGHNLLQTFLHQKRLYPDTKAAKNDYDIYLYHYSMYLENKEKLNEKIVKSICEKDSSVLLECPIITAYEGDSEDVINEKIKEGLKHNMVILRGFLRNFNLNNSLFTLENLEKNFNLQNQIDVVEQEKDFFGFLPNRHLRKNMSLGDYIKYVKSFEDGSKRKIPKTKSAKERLLYGVNVELTAYKPLMNELENKLNPLFLFGSAYDTLSYVRNHINGMTIPQMYIKVPGVWTGGHEENLRMRSINVCHGPGSSYWWATPTGDSNKLVEKVKEKYDINIYKKEGIWFPDTDFFLSNNIKVLYTEQQAGDIVLVGSGTIHWVRAKAHSINTSWNFSAKEVFDLQSSMARYEINQEIKIRSLVPMKTLIMDVLNTEMFKLSLDYVKCCASYIIPSMTESISKLSSIKEEFQSSTGKYNIGIFKEEEMYMVETCEMCLSEVFNLWAFCQECSKAKEQFIVCLNCFRLHLSHCYNPKMQFIFYKYEASEMMKFLDRVNFRLKFDNQMECKDLSEPQPALKKSTKDNKSITEKMKFKTIINSDDFIHFKDYYYLYKNLDTNEISSLLIPLIDPEKLSSEDFRMPLKSSKENFIDPYIDYEDLYYEESNKQRFSPTNARVNSNRDDDINIHYIFTGDDSIVHNENKNNIFDVNSNMGRIQSLNSSIRMSPRNNIRTKFNSNLPGRAFFEDVEVADTFDVRSNNGFAKNDSNKMLCPASPRSNIFSLVSDVHRMKKLKNDLSLLHEEKEIDLKFKSDDFSVMDIFNGMFSSSNNDERRNSDEKKNSIEDIKIAKSLLSDLTGKEAVSKYKFISNIHTNIWKGKELILRHIDNKEICELTKLRPFVERIISNSFLINAYRDIFRSEIYDRII